MSRSAQSLRYAIFYGAIFLAIGVYLPFWPVWLAHRGLDAREIGIVLAAAAWLKVVSTPVMAQISDRSGRAKMVLVVLAGLSVISYAAFLPAGGFWPILAITLIAAIASQALVPLSESLTMTAVYAEHLDYGRIRLWGSITFIVGSVGAGRLLTDSNSELVLWLVIAALSITFFAALGLPGRKTARPGSASSDTTRPGWASLLSNRHFLLFLIAASFLQASHAVYYAFSSLHWQNAGINETVIGWLWAEGVIAEILLFAVSAAVMSRVSPVALLLIAGLAGVLRWTVLGSTTALPALLIVQGLHGATFGAAHLGAMHFIARTAPPGLSASAQSLNAVLSGGIAMGLAMYATGPLYDAFGGQAFWTMAGLSAIGMLLALPLLGRHGALIKEHL